MPAHRASPLHTLAAAAWAILLIAGIVLTLGAALAIAGYDASRALGALWEGSVGSTYALGSATLVRTVPLLLAGLAVALAFRAGVWNIGAEGQILAGAAAAAAVSIAWAPALGRGALPVGLLAGLLAGAAWVGPPALLRQRFGVLEVISTIMMNFVALYFVGWLVRGPMQEPLGIYPQSPELPDAARMPRMFAAARVHWGLPLALAASVGLWWVLAHTAAGFRIRASGASPSAARTAGLIDVSRTTTRAFLASGALAGLAGAVEVTGVTFALYENLSPGYGFTAIAVALLARLHPLIVVPSALLFGALDAGAGAMQRDAGVPSVIVSVITALLILLVIVADRLRTGGFATLPFRRRGAAVAAATGVAGGDEP
jgi:simple sugar transport system permease protein